MELLLAVVDLTRALAEVGFGLGDPLLALVDAFPGGLGEVGVFSDRRLAVGKLLLARLEAARPLVEVAASGAFALDAVELGIAAVELGLAGDQLRLAASISASRACICCTSAPDDVSWRSSCWVSVRMRPWRS